MCTRSGLLLNLDDDLKLPERVREREQARPSELWPGLLTSATMSRETAHTLTIDMSGFRVGSTSQAEADD